MSDANREDWAAGRLPFARQLPLISLVALAALVVGGVIFAYLMRCRENRATQNDLAATTEIFRLRLTNAVNSDIAAVSGMASDPAVRAYFRSPDDPQRRDAALAAFAVYRRQLADGKIFWVSDVDKNLHVDDLEPYVINPELPENYWYGETLRSSRYYFDVNYEAVLRRVALWINAPVKIAVAANEEKTVGIVGRYYDFTTLSQSLYQNIASPRDVVAFNRRGEITMARDPRWVGEKKPLAFALGDAARTARELAEKMSAGANRVAFAQDGKFYSLQIAPETGWYLVGSEPASATAWLASPLTLWFAAGALLWCAAIFGVNWGTRRRDDARRAEQRDWEQKNTGETQARQQQNAEAARSRNDFMALMSHQIRTPLSAIMGMSDLAQKENAGPVLAGYIAGIRAASGNLLTIVNDLLDLSAIELHNFELSPEVYETVSLLNNVLAEMRQQIEYKSAVKLTTEIAPDLPKLLSGDYDRLRRMVISLLTNAVKHTARGEIRFVVSGERPAAGKIILRFIIADAVPAADAPQQAYVSSLDLRMTLLLARAMGGDLEMSTQMGERLHFTLTVCQQILEDEAIGDFDAIAERQAAFTPDFRAPEASVLVVDDTQSNLVVARGLLQQYGIVPQSCWRGRKAIDLIRSRRFDLIFMDHMMPEMDGVEATSIIRAMDGDQPIIVALTANAVPGMRDLFLTRGFDDFIAKPIDRHRLDEVLRKWLPREKQIAVASGAAAGAENGETPEKIMDAPAAQVSSAPASATPAPEALKPAAPVNINTFIEGVDVVAGLDNLGGMTDVYLELLTAFCDDMDQRMAVFSAVPADESGWTNFTIQMHAAKGAAASIGAKELSALALKLQKAGENRDRETLAQELSPFCRDLAAIVKNIRRALGQ
ncbi:MAG: response regulator [Planctomycetota bacterium]|jgi:signal transduction histidine kinase/DNA-binding response OmpR family regulator/HPt (histidine-containing phosphotransfer) domain-containing protein|nr:response regulator [Planctomycetota bacterium]